MTHLRGYGRSIHVCLVAWMAGSGLTYAASASGPRAPGAVHAWGANHSGQLGNNQTDNFFNTPIANGLDDVIEIRGGGGHTLALMSDGTVQSWGANWNGGLGDGTLTPRASPGPVPGLSGVVGIAAGRVHSLALLENGAVMSWGGNTQGQLGNPSFSFSTSPIAVVGLPSDVVRIAAGENHSLAVTRSGAVWAWGWNRDGQLGVSPDSLPDSPLPRLVPGVAAVDVAGGSEHSVALGTDGSVFCWGANTKGQLGDASGTFTTPVPSPVRAQGVNNAVAVAAGWHFTLALLSDGTVYSWGSNANGQLGHDTFNTTDTPDVMKGVGPVQAVAAGAFHTLALLRDGTLRSFGYNTFGQLGDGSSDYHSEKPRRVLGLSNKTVFVAAGHFHSLALVSKRKGPIDFARELLRGPLTPYLWGAKGFDYDGGIDGCPGKDKGLLSPTEVKSCYDYYDLNNRKKADDGGLDCSGLVYWSYTQAFGPAAVPQAAGFVGTEYLYDLSDSLSSASAQPGDLVFFNTRPGVRRVTHVAMYTEGKESGRPRIIEAKGPEGNGPGVREIDLQDHPYQPTYFVGYRRMKDKAVVAMLAQTYSPIRLTVTDPTGLTIDDRTEVPADDERLWGIPGVLYYVVTGTDESFRAQDAVVSPQLKQGRYIVKVSPKPGTTPVDTYGLEFRTPTTSLMLADQVAIADIPSVGYGVHVTSTGVFQFIPVIVDVKPHDHGAAPINPRSHGLTPVAVLSSPTFDASTLDVASLRLGRGEAAASKAEMMDVDHDGRRDLLAHFRTRDIGVVAEDTQVCLVGSAQGQDIHGCDSIRVVPASRPR